MNGSPWTAAERAAVRRRYPHEPTRDIARDLGRSERAVYAQANLLGVKKSQAFLSAQLRALGAALAASDCGHRYPKGLVPWNKGLRRPGWAPGRMAQTQFQRGGRSPRWPEDVYYVGCLRENGDGIVYIKMHNGHRPWRPLHVVLWEDAHGPVPCGHVIAFRDRDHFNIELPNLECIPRAELLRRNSVHNLPKPLVSAIQLLGQLKRRIRERHEKHR